jgi:hypothetical protein
LVQFIKQQERLWKEQHKESSNGSKVCKLTSLLSFIDLCHFCDRQILTR